MPKSTIVIDARGADQKAVSKLQAALANLDQTIEVRTLAASASGSDISGDGEDMVTCPECGKKTMSKSSGKCDTCGASSDPESDNSQDGGALRLHMNPNHKGAGPGGGQFASKEGDSFSGKHEDKETGLVVSGAKHGKDGKLSIVVAHPRSKLPATTFTKEKDSQWKATVGSRNEDFGEEISGLDRQLSRLHAGVLKAASNNQHGVDNHPDYKAGYKHGLAGKAHDVPEGADEDRYTEGYETGSEEAKAKDRKLASSAKAKTYAAADGISFRIGKQKPYGAGMDVAYPMPTDPPGTDENGGEDNTAEDWAEIPYSVQAVIFNRDQFTLADAMAWLKDNQFYGNSWLESPSFLEFQLSNDDWYEPASLITVDAKTYDAQEAYKVYQKTHDVTGIEIFKTGKWNGDDYDEKDLDDMVTAFDQVGYQPPVKLGHENSPGERAWGWVSKIYRKGKVLLADLKDVPAELYKQIKERAFDHVSSEIFWNLERDGTKHRRALKAIALLGAETPAVSGLAPLRTAVLSQEGGEVHVSNLSTEELEMDKVAQLTATIADLRKQIAAGGDTKKVAELSTKLSETETEREKLYTEQAQKLADQAKTIAEQSKSLDTLSGSVKSLTETVTSLTESAQAASIKASVTRCTVPAFQPALAALYELAVQSPSRVAKYTEGDKSAELNAASLLDKIVDVINSNATKLFSIRTTATKPGEHYDTGADAGARPDVEMEKAINKYFADHPAKSVGKPSVAEYKEARRAVAALNPELAKQYAEFTAPRVH